MKKTIAVASLFAAIASSNVLAAELVVAVDNIQEIKGSLYVSLYNKAANFDYNNDAVKRQKIAVDKSNMTINLGDVPAGEYAVKAFHDVNDNGQLDFTSSGMPGEPYGSSSSSKELAPPSYNAAKFTLDKNQQVQVHLLK